MAELNARAGMTWRAGMNGKFVNMTLGEAKRLMGAKRDPKRRAALPVVDRVAAVPATFNATDAWPQCAAVIGHIRDQSDCGCCWVSFFGGARPSLCSFCAARCLRSAVEFACGSARVWREHASRWGLLPPSYHAP